MWIWERERERERKSEQQKQKLEQNLNKNIQALGSEEVIRLSHIFLVTVYFMYTGQKKRQASKQGERCRKRLRMRISPKVDLVFASWV